MYAEGDDFEGLVLRVDLETGGVDTVFAPDRVDPPLKRRGGAFDARPVAIGPDGNDLVIRSLPDALVWNLKTGCRRFSCTLTGHPAPCAAVSPDGAQLAIPGVQVLDFRTGKRLKEFELKFRPGAGGVINKLAFSPDSKLLVETMDDTVDMPDYVAVWRTDKYSEPVVFRSATGGAGLACFVPGTHRLVTAGICGAYLWDLDKLSWPKEEKQEGTKKK